MAHEVVKPIPIYLSAAVSNSALNLELRGRLPADRYELVLPQEFTPEIPHITLERAIYQLCIDEMERSAAGILLLDAFGIDCAMESGWYAANKKPLVGIANSTARFTSNWMVKGALTHFVTMQSALYEQVKDDNIFSGHCKCYLLNDWSELAAVLDEAIAQ